MRTAIFARCVRHGSIHKRNNELLHLLPLAQLRTQADAGRSRAACQADYLQDTLLTAGPLRCRRRGRLALAEPGVRDGVANLAFFFVLSEGRGCPTRTYTGFPPRCPVLFTCRGLKSCFELVGARWNQLNPGDLSPRFVEVSESMPGRRIPRESKNKRFLSN